jgi:hypothetical protein
MRNVFEELLKLGHDEDFVPRDISELRPSDAPVGSRRKLEVMAERVRLGFPLFHPDDSPDYGEEEGDRAPSRRGMRR